MSLVVHSLQNATTTGPGFVASFDKPRKVSMQLVITGAPTAYEVDLEMSIDGVNYVSVGNIQASNLTNQFSFYAPFARANLVTLTGGASPTVNAWLAATDD